ncbi:protein of unknown function [Chryseobacterium sp. JV274]|nr:protein of unknown function [Chryseobacterium sp. JV274]
MKLLAGKEHPFISLSDKIVFIGKSNKISPNKEIYLHIIRQTDLKSNYQFHIQDGIYLKIGNIFLTFIYILLKVFHFLF